MYPDSDTEGHRPVPSQGFGELSKYPVPKCTVEPGADINTGEPQMQTDFGVKDGSEVANPTTINGYGIK